MIFYEPTTYLDLRHQFELLEMLVQLKERDKTILLVLARFGACAALQRPRCPDAGRQDGGAGTPEHGFERRKLDEVFGICTHAAAEGYWFAPRRS
ncbi:MAG: hypothetical protein ACLS69_05525 [Butyricicoccus sp.]